MDEEIESADTKKSLPIMVSREDISMIGHTHFSKEGCLHIICGEISLIEEIFLRSILNCFGSDYRIIGWKYLMSDNDNELNDNKIFQTNLPWELYLEAIG